MLHVVALANSASLFVSCFFGSVRSLISKLRFDLVRLVSLRTGTASTCVVSLQFFALGFAPFRTYCSMSDDWAVLFSMNAFLCIWNDRVVTYSYSGLIFCTDNSDCLVVSPRCG